MISLIMKDIFIQKRSVISMLVFIGIFLLIDSNNPLVSSYYFLSVSLAYVFSTGSFAYEEKNKCDLVTSSLPITRKEIVLSKYIGILIFAILSLIGTSILGIVFSLTNIGGFKIQYVTLTEIKSIIFSCIVLSSIMLPIYFKFGYLKGKIVNIVVYLSFFIVSMFVITCSEFKQIKNILNFINSSTGNMLMLVIVVITYVLSMYISITTYSNKDL